MTKYPVYWVVIPFPSQEMAESALAEVDEIGYRAKVIRPTGTMIDRYVCECKEG